MATPRKIDREELKALWRDSDMTQVQMAAHFGCSRYAVGLAAKRAGLPPRPSASKKIDADQLRRMWSDPGMKLAAIAAHFGCSDSAVSQAAKAAGLPPRPRRASGSGRQPEQAAPKPPRLTASPHVAPEGPRDDRAVLTGRLLDSKGRYTALAEIAQGQGWTMAEAQRRWHVARAGQ